ncbi:cytochrome P450 [Actinomycetospora atypica]|uniref:Cytochrome P450 n=1 Tax=Actinomycetospora atypica TaxID=1290095 RepID=A0ABV9YRR8_9PSEU
MTACPHAGIDPFAARVHGPDEPGAPHAALRAAGPVVEVAAPAGGHALVVTRADLAREVWNHPDLVKDPAWAPASWDRTTGVVEPTAAEAPSLSTLDGPAHLALRRAHAPMFAPRRIRELAAGIEATVRELLAGAGPGEVVDLVPTVTVPFPATVLLDLVGAPRSCLATIVEACAGMQAGDPAAFGSFFAVAGAAVGEGDGIAAELAGRLDGADPVYQVFSVLFVGQLTTQPLLGLVLARALAAPGLAADDVVEQVLREHPPAPFGLWRFAVRDTSVGGVAVAAGTPVLVDLVSAQQDTEVTLAFGGGPHVCIGAHLARLELAAAVRVLRAEYPDARLAVDHDALVARRRAGTDGSRLDELPVVLVPAG